MTQADLYASPSMAGGRQRMGTPTGSHVSDYPVPGGKSGPFSDAGTRAIGSPSHAHKGTLTTTCSPPPCFPPVANLRVVCIAYIEWSIRI